MRTRAVQSKLTLRRKCASTLTMYTCTCTHIHEAIHTPADVCMNTHTHQNRNKHKQGHMHNHTHKYADTNTNTNADTTKTQTITQTQQMTDICVLFLPSVLLDRPNPAARASPWRRPADPTRKNPSSAWRYVNGRCNHNVHCMRDSITQLKELPRSRHFGM